jgi:site-specific recombinase XerD
MINFSVVAVLFKNRISEDGIYKIAIRTTINRKVKYEVTGYKAHEREFVKGKFVDNKIRNRALAQEIAKREQRISELLASGEEISIEKLNKPVRQTFKEFCDSQIKNLETSKEPGTLRNYDKQLKKWFAFYQGWDITPKKLNDYKIILSKSGLSENSVWDSFKVLKKFYRLAMNEGLVKENPFVRMESAPKYESIAPEYLTLEELDSIEECELTSDLAIVRDYFLLECYSGLRFSDWSRFTIEQIGNERNLKVRAKKNGEPVYLPIDSSPRLARVIDRLQPYSFSLEHTNRMLKLIGLAAKLNKNLRTHIGRHTFAVMCANLGLSVETTAELMGISMKVASVYYKVTRTKVKDEFKAWGSI